MKRKEKLALAMAQLATARFAMKQQDITLAWMYARLAAKYANWDLHPGLEMPGLLAIEAEIRERLTKKKTDTLVVALDLIAQARESLEDGEHLNCGSAGYYAKQVTRLPELVGVEIQWSGYEPNLDLLAEDVRAALSKKKKVADALQVCQGCSFWEPTQAGYGACHNSHFIQGRQACARGWDEKNNLTYWSARQDETIVLRTGEDFGCVHFEKKEK
jgi:hypothetical protein